MSEPQQVLETMAPLPPPAKTQATLHSPVHHLHLALGARFMQVAQWAVPAAYAALEAERQAIAGLAVADISARGKVDLRGDLDAILGRLSVGEALVARLSSRWALLLTVPGGAEALTAVGEPAAGSSGMVTDATYIYAGFALLGSRVDELLQRLVAVDLSEVRPGLALTLQLARVPAILVRGPAATELYFASEYGRYAWQTLIGSGHPLGIQPVGWEALKVSGWS